MLELSLRLHFRNRLALLYSYFFPTLFLFVFYVLYRYDQVPLVRHMGELLTVTVLGGACFGLPTTLVSERERGVWRRYRLAPVPTRELVASTLVARYVLLLLAGLLQLALALALGMPLPRHPYDLWVAFTLVAFAFLGLGLVMANVAGMADIQQLTLERHIPLLVFDQLRADIPREDLIKILYWIAIHPEDGPVIGGQDVRAPRRSRRRSRRASQPRSDLRRETSPETAREQLA